MLYRIGFIENNGFNLCKFEFPYSCEEGNSILKVKQMYFIPTDNIEFREKDNVPYTDMVERGFVTFVMAR